MGAVFRKEMKIYTSGMFGYLVMALLLAFAGLFVTLFNLVSGYASISYALIAMHWVLIVLIPILSMRSIAEERHAKTDQLLYSLPLRMRDVVLGKFLALAALFAMPTAVTALYPILLSCFGGFELASSYVALLGYLLLGTAMIALCTFLSSLAENQVIAATVSIAALLVLYCTDSIAEILPTSAIVSLVILVGVEIGLAGLVWMATKNKAMGFAVAAFLLVPTALLYIIKASLFTSLIPNFLYSINLFSRYGGFIYGYIDLCAVLFYLSFIAFFLFATVKVMEKRRFM